VHCLQQYMSILDKKKTSFLSARTPWIMLPLTLGDIRFQLAMDFISVWEKQLAVDSESPVGASYLFISSQCIFSSHFPNGELVETLTVVQARNESSGALIQALWWGSNGVFRDRHLCLCSHPTSLSTHTLTHAHFCFFHLLPFTSADAPLPFLHSPPLLFLSPPSSVLKGSHSPSYRAARLVCILTV